LGNRIELRIINAGFNKNNQNLVVWPQAETQVLGVLIPKWN